MLSVANPWARAHRQTCWIVAVMLLACNAPAAYSPDGRLRAAPSDDSRLVVGELITLTSRHLTVETASGEVVLGVSDAVRVTIDGKRAKLRDLQPLQFVEIETEEDGTDLLARVIHARSRMRCAGKDSIVCWWR